MDAVVKRLLQQVRAIGVKVRFLLLDKGFFSAEVVRHLQRARGPFLMPAFARGQKPEHPKPGSLRDVQQRTTSGWAGYCWTNTNGLRATVSIAIVSKNDRGQRGRHGRRTQLYACWGLRQRSAAWIDETYRKRFGIETSDRQMHEARIRTTTRNPLLRFLFVAIALILRNVWVWCHRNWLAVRRGPGLDIREERLRMGEMLLGLEHWVKEEFGLCLPKAIPPPT